MLAFGLAFPLACSSSWDSRRAAPDPDLGGLSLIATYVPILIAFNLAMLGISVLPTALVDHRERGVLRRLATTPVAPWRLLTAQLLVNGLVAVGAVLVVLAVARTSRSASACPGRRSASR